MSSGLKLVDVVADCLLGRTDAGDSVYVPGDWPTQDGDYPCLLVRLILDEKISGGAAAPNFRVTSTIRVFGEVRAAADVLDRGGSAAETAVVRLQRQAEVAVIGNPLVWAAGVAQFPTVRTQYGVNADGEQHLGGFAMDLALEHYQGAEDFYGFYEGPEVEGLGLDDMTEVSAGMQLPGAPDDRGFDLNLPT